MPIRVTIDGTEFEADTAAEIVELKRLLSPAAKPSINGNHRDLAPQVSTVLPQAGDVSTAGSVAAPRSTLFTRTPDLHAFVRALNPNGRKVVSAILGAFPGSIGTSAIAAEAQLGAMSLPPIFKHVRSAATKAGFDPDTVIARRQVVVNDRVLSEYELGKDIAQELKVMLQ